MSNKKDIRVKVRVMGCDDYNEAELAVNKSGLNAIVDMANKQNLDGGGCVPTWKVGVWNVEHQEWDTKVRDPRDT